MPDRHDDIDGWLSERIDPLPPPPGTFELIKRRARRRKYRRLAVGAGVAAVIVAAAVTVPQGVSLPVGSAGRPAAAAGSPISAKPTGGGTPASRSASAVPSPTGLAPGPSNSGGRSVTLPGTETGGEMREAGGG